jgi:hypothetical protein
MARPSAESLSSRFSSISNATLRDLEKAQLRIVIIGGDRIFCPNFALDAEPE